MKGMRLIRAKGKEKKKLSDDFSVSEQVRVVFWVMSTQAGLFYLFQFCIVVALVFVSVSSFSLRIRNAASEAHSGGDTGCGARSSTSSRSGFRASRIARSPFRRGRPNPLLERHQGEPLQLGRGPMRARPRRRASPPRCRSLRRNPGRYIRESDPAPNPQSPFQRTPRFPPFRSGLLRQPPQPLHSAQLAQRPNPTLSV